MNKSQGRVQAGSVPVRRGGRGGSLLQGGAVYYVAKCPGGHSTTGGRLLRDRSMRIECAFSQCRFNAHPFLA